MKQLLRILVAMLIILYGNSAKAIPVPPALPVVDFAAIANAVATLQNLKMQLEYHKEMAEQIGKGNFTPSSISYLGNLYTQCIGKKWVLPDYNKVVTVTVCKIFFKASSL